MWTHWAMYTTVTRAGKVSARSRPGNACELLEERAGLKREDEAGSLGAVGLPTMPCGRLRVPWSFRPTMLKIVAVYFACCRSACHDECGCCCPSLVFETAGPGARRWSETHKECHEPRTSRKRSLGLDLSSCTATSALGTAGRLGVHATDTAAPQR